MSNFPSWHTHGRCLGHLSCHAEAKKDDSEKRGQFSSVGSVLFLWSVNAWQLSRHIFFWYKMLSKWDKRHVLWLSPKGLHDEFEFQFVCIENLAYVQVLELQQQERNGAIISRNDSSASLGITVPEVHIPLPASRSVYVCGWERLRGTEWGKADLKGGVAHAADPRSGASR